MKNPFERIGKVIKYEFKHSARTLLPLYGVLLILGLLTGLSVSQQKYDKITQQQIDIDPKLKADINNFEKAKNLANVDAVYGYQEAGVWHFFIANDM